MKDELFIQIQQQFLKLEYITKAQVGRDLEITVLGGKSRKIKKK